MRLEGSEVGCRGACPPPDKYRGRGPQDTSSALSGTKEIVGGAGVQDAEGGRTESPGRVSLPLPLKIKKTDGKVSLF